MNAFDKDIQGLANSGFRSPADWAQSGRNVVAEAKPRFQTTNRGQAVSLYSRDQTVARPKVIRVKGARPAPAATPEATSPDAPAAAVVA
jgi:hypothetical protein